MAKLKTFSRGGKKRREKPGYLTELKQTLYLDSLRVGGRSGPRTYLPFIFITNLQSNTPLAICHTSLFLFFVCFVCLSTTMPKESDSPNPRATPTYPPTYPPTAKIMACPDNRRRLAVMTSALPREIPRLDQTHPRASHPATRAYVVPILPPTS